MNHHGGIIIQRGGATAVAGAAASDDHCHSYYNNRRNGGKNKSLCHQHDGDDQCLTTESHSLRFQMKKQSMFQSLSFGQLLSNVQRQYAQRIAADSNFLYKSITEVILAAGTQFMAEVGKRGIHQIVTEIDFVIAGILTAIAGKYYSMWRVAPTSKVPTTGDENDVDDVHDSSSARVRHKSVKVLDTKNDNEQMEKAWDIPTNAFQTNLPYSLSQRLMSFIVPIPSLFQAGVVASAIGYGFTSFLIFLRSILFPNYVAATVNVNTLHACLYTGAFMALVSNVRYQLLQGIIEPYFVDKLFGKFPFLRACMTFAVRLGNGLLGSFLAIAGMKMMGLQKLKS
jgi:hypothetical protein